MSTVPVCGLANKHLNSVHVFWAEETHFKVATTSEYAIYWHSILHHTEYLRNYCLQGKSLVAVRTISKVYFGLNALTFYVPLYDMWVL